MIFLLLSVLCSAMLMVGFKLFPRYKVDTFHAIVINYITCVVVGMIPLFLNQGFTGLETSNVGWVPYSIILGFMFIGLFFLIGITTQKIGVSVATVSMKLGYILPIILAFTFYDETINSYKVIGVFLTVLAVILTSIKTEKNIEQQDSLPDILYIVLPLVIFIGSGIADSIVQFTEKTFFKNGGMEAFNIILFATASLIGLGFAIFQDVRSGKSKFNKKNVIAGVLLGIPNYGSIYFLFKTLNTPGWESSMVFPINNIAIVLASTLLAVAMFSEKLSKINIAGLILALISIVLMSPYLRNIFGL